MLNVIFLRLFLRFQLPLVSCRYVKTWLIVPYTIWHFSKQLMIAVNLLSCFVSWWREGESSSLLRVINSLMCWCIATKLIKYQRLFNCPVIHTDSDRWKRNPRNDLMTPRHVELCNLIVHENSDRNSDRKFSTTAHSLKLQLYCMSSVTQRAIIGYRGFMCYNYARTGIRVSISEQQERIRDRLPHWRLCKHFDGRTKKKKPR